MINSRELLKNFSRRLGIPESEGRLSLEIFAKLISQKLGFGDEVEIESLGYFTYKKVKPVRSESDEYQKIILFSEEKISGQNKNFLLFFLPDESNKEFPHIDSFLNLSFGKPLITSVKIAETEFVLSTSNNEIISLIESKVEKLFSDSKIHKCTEENEQEFSLSTSEEEILFDTGLQNEPVDEVDEPEFELEPDTPIISDEKKIINTFDDFELVEPDKVAPLEESVSENEKNTKWVFDDLNIQDDADLHNQKDSASTLDGYSEVKDPFSKKTTLSDSRNENDDLGKSLDSSLGVKLKKSTMRKLVPALIGLILIAASASAVYLNYDKIKSMVFKDSSNLSQNVETKKRTEPIVIDRTFEIPVTYPYKLVEGSLSQIPDSLIINPAVFISKQISSSNSLSNTVLIPISDNEISNELVRVQENIYQRGSEFIVQVTSWKSKSKAEKELKKYIENGFRAELIEESSSNLGKYHRVMIGGFNSIDEANNFLNKNK